MAVPPKNQETPKFDKPNYANARGKAASLANNGKHNYDNPDSNPGHVESTSRPGLENKAGGWNSDVERTLIVKTNEKNPNGPVIEPHGIRRI